MYGVEVACVSKYQHAHTSKMLEYTIIEKRQETWLKLQFALVRLCLQYKSVSNHSFIETGCAAL